MTAPTTVRVYVNEQGVSVPPGSVARDAVAALRPADAAAIDAGTMRLTDSRGLPIEATTTAVSGMILRVVAVRERLEDAT
ncbi:MAG: hypothetical protein IT353_09615 [Gemmatimonadaceae bacterium]|nr:hypothetical protein [Gemmatimonadaceae bacterium]